MLLKLGSFNYIHTRMQSGEKGLICFHHTMVYLDEEFMLSVQIDRLVVLMAQSID